MADEGWKAMRKKRSSGNALTYIILILGVGIVALPFVWMILTSLKTNTEAVSVPVKFFPSSLRWGTYAEIFKRIPFLKMFSNTAVSSIISVIGQLVICSLAGYSFAKLRFPGKDQIFVVVLAVLMIPGSAYILTQYQIIQDMGLLNTITALFLPKCFSAYGTYLMRQFFIALPDELRDAAEIDGCSHIQTFTRIYLPLAKPGLVALGIIALKYSWNDLMWPLIVNSSLDKMTLSAGLSYMAGQYEIEYPLMMAGAVLAVLPLLIVFVVFQKQFIAGVANTGIKG